MSKSYEGYNPKSLQNLAPEFTKENAKDMQLRAAAARKANAAARNALKASVKDWKQIKDDVLPEFDMTSIDVLKVLMIKAINDNDLATAADLAKSLAEYEKPKLSRVESKVEEVTSNDLSDDELDARLRALRVVK